jgi:hypothetical protein
MAQDTAADALAVIDRTLRSEDDGGPRGATRLGMRIPPGEFPNQPIVQVDPKLKVGPVLERVGGDISEPGSGSVRYVIRVSDAETAAWLAAQLEAWRLHDGTLDTAAVAAALAAMKFGPPFGVPVHSWE